MRHIDHLELGVDGIGGTVTWGLDGVVVPWRRFAERGKLPRRHSMGFKQRSTTSTTKFSRFVHFWKVYV